MKPEKVFRIGWISASVFVNEVESDGGKRKVRNVTLQRRYRDNDGGWQTANSFGLQDLPGASRVLDMALDYVASKEADATPH